MEPTSSLEAIASRQAFQAAIRAAVERAAAEDAPHMVFVDADFDAWPLDERAVVEALGRWASAHRRLTLVAASFESLARRAPRFVEWRRVWSHIVTCRGVEDIDPEQMPTWLWIEGLTTVRLDDRLRHRGIVSTQPVDEVAAREAIDALLQRSVEAFPATTLGL